MSRAVLSRRAGWVLALVSLTWGVWRSMQPEALVDLHRVADWARLLTDGVSPFAGESETDYPPWALLTLWPLGALAPDWRGPVWVAVNLLLAAGIARALAREADEPRPIQGALIGLLLAASCFRVLSQFSLLSFYLAWIGARHPSPWRGSLWLGLGLLKPQVGGALWLAHVLARDWRRTAGALVVPIAATVAAALWTGTPPLALVADYLRALETAQGGEELFSGHTDLEPWLAVWMPGVRSLTGAAVVTSVLLSPLVVVAWRRQPRPHLEWYAWCGVTSLLATRHLSYDFVLLLPVIVAWRTGPWSSTDPPARLQTAWWMVTGLIVAQVPGWWRRLAEPMFLAGSGSLLTELDRVLCVAVYCLLWWRFVRLDMTK